MKPKYYLSIMIVIISLMVASAASAAEKPMLNKYVSWEYGDSLDRFSGYIPALGKRVEDNPWKLYHWAGVFTFPDGKSRSLSTYDVFSVKEKPTDPIFNKENGFGLVYKSQEALGDLFDAVWAGQAIPEKQRKYFKEKFMANADDPVFKNGHEYYYRLQQKFEFLRTSGIIVRMGVKFDKTKKVSDDFSRAYYEVSAWPTLKVTQGKDLSISFTSSGYTERQVRVVAIPKGAFPNFSKQVKLTAVVTENQNYEKTVKIPAKDLSVLGSNVDIVIDDGYGRTQIQSVKLADDLKMDFVPTKLTLTEAGQLWVKFRYDGEDILTSDYLSERGMPMKAQVKIGGGVTTSFDMSSMFKKLPEQLKKGTEMSYALGKIEISQNPGTYYIKVDTTVNNPDHPDRMLESPNEAFWNNTIHGEWKITRGGATVDLIAQAITVKPNSIKQGSKSMVTAKVKNVSSQLQNNVMIRFFDNQKKVYEVRKNLHPNEVTSVGPFTWAGNTPGVHNLTVIVDPDNEFPDSDRSNNVASTGCSVIGSGGAGSGECNNNSDSGSWNVTYRLITGYHTKTRSVTWYDAKGKPHTISETYTDYNDPIWESRDVGYQESLNISAMLDTRQNISTDLKHPKESDQESRGSWEIIPYAKKNGKDASQITRAGYGFEIKVKTNYSTNWETKVPKGLEGTAKPFGGTYHGPDRVYAQIYDSKNRFVKQVELEKTGGNKDTATWELPEVTTKSSSGKSYKSRKFFTDVAAPDGYYTVKILSSSAGMTGLSVCTTKKIEIWGSMYDDTQNLRGSK